MFGSGSAAGRGVTGGHRSRRPRALAGRRAAARPGGAGPGRPPGRAASSRGARGRLAETTGHRGGCAGGGVGASGPRPPASPRPGRPGPALGARAPRGGWAAARPRGRRSGQGEWGRPGPKALPTRALPSRPGPGGPRGSRTEQGAWLLEKAGEEPLPRGSLRGSGSLLAILFAAFDSSV